MHRTSWQTQNVFCQASCKMTLRRSQTTDTRTHSYCPKHAQKNSPKKKLEFLINTVYFLHPNPYNNRSTHSEFRNFGKFEFFYMGEHSWQHDKCAEIAGEGREALSGQMHTTGWQSNPILRKFSGLKFHVMILDKTRKCAEIPGKGGWGKLRLIFVRGGRAGELRVEPEWNISFHETVRASSLSLPWLAIAGPFILNLNLLQRPPSWADHSLPHSLTSCTWMQMDTPWLIPPCLYMAMAFRPKTLPLPQLSLDPPQPALSEYCNEESPRPYSVARTNKPVQS